MMRMRPELWYWGAAAALFVVWLVLFGMLLSGR